MVVKLVLKHLFWQDGDSNALGDSIDQGCCACTLPHRFKEKNLSGRIQSRSVPVFHCFLTKQKFLILQTVYGDLFFSR